VDQFEELFRFRAAQRNTTSTKRPPSSNSLLEAAQQRDLSIYIVLTMRSDFLGDCAQFQGLPEAINDGQYLIPRMTRDERRFAVTGPVGVTRGKITEPLINRLLNDVGDNPDQLPILQHALMRTWEHWQAIVATANRSDSSTTKRSARCLTRFRVTPTKRSMSCRTNVADRSRDVCSRRLLNAAPTIARFVDRRARHDLQDHGR
jgi:hypothetical protein